MALVGRREVEKRLVKGIREGDAYLLVVPSGNPFEKRVTVYVGKAEDVSVDGVLLMSGYRSRMPTCSRDTLGSRISSGAVRPRQCVGDAVLAGDEVSDDALATHCGILSAVAVDKQDSQEDALKNIYERFRSGDFHIDLKKVGDRRGLELQQLPPRVYEEIRQHIDASV